jgi:prepilin-type N-terminal cleavage/methylation domain-containing protein
MRTRRSRTGDGFTLIEILVSLAILSVSLAALLGVFSMSLDRAGQSQDEMTARTLARSLLEQAAADPASRGGVFDRRFSWRIDFAPYGQRRDAPATGVPLASVAARVVWQGSGGTRSLTLYSLRAMPAQNAP